MMRVQGNRVDAIDVHERVKVLLDQASYLRERARPQGERSISGQKRHQTDRPTTLSSTERRRPPLLIAVSLPDFVP